MIDETIIVARFRQFPPASDGSDHLEEFETSYEFAMLVLPVLAAFPPSSVLHWMRRDPGLVVPPDIVPAFRRDLARLAEAEPRVLGPMPEDPEFSYRPDWDGILRCVDAAIDGHNYVGVLTCPFREE